MIEKKVYSVKNVYKDPQHYQATYCHKYCVYIIDEIMPSELCSICSNVNLFQCDHCNDWYHRICCKGTVSFEVQIERVFEIKLQQNLG